MYISSRRPGRFQGEGATFAPARPRRRSIIAAVAAHSPKWGFEIKKTGRKAIACGPSGNYLSQIIGKSE